MVIVSPPQKRKGRRSSLSLLSRFHRSLLLLLPILASPLPTTFSDHILLLGLFSIGGQCHIRRSYDENCELITTFLKKKIFAGCFCLQVWWSYYFKTVVTGAMIMMYYKLRIGLFFGSSLYIKGKGCDQKSKCVAT